MKRLTTALVLFLALSLAASALATAISFSAAFPEVSVLKAFAHDYGDRLEKVTYKGVDYTPAEATRPVLMAHGWADPANRVRLGRAWAEEIAFPGDRVLETAPLGFVTSVPFTPPQAELLPDGTFRFTAWFQRLTGREPGGVLRQGVEISTEAEMTTFYPTSKAGKIPGEGEASGGSKLGR